MRGAILATAGVRAARDGLRHASSRHAGATTSLRWGPALECRHQVERYGLAVAGISVRTARPGAGQRSPASTALWPPTTSRSRLEEIDAQLVTASASTLHLVAEIDGSVAAALVAHYLAPADDVDRQIQPDLTQPRPRIDYLATAEQYRSRGLASRLVDAASPKQDVDAALAEWSGGRTSPISRQFLSAPGRI